MRSQSIRSLAVPVVAAALLVLPSSARAGWEDDPGSVRKGRWDISALGGWSVTNTLDRSTNGSDDSLEFEDIPFGGVRFEAHLTDALALAFQVTGTRPDYVFDQDSGGTTLRAEDDVVMTWIDADLTWRFLPRRSTPFALAGFGAFNIADDHIGNVYFAEQHFEYHLAIGWEFWIKSHLLVSVSVRASANDLELWPDTLIATQGIIGVGWRSGPPRDTQYRMR